MKLLSTTLLTQKAHKHTTNSCNKFRHSQ